MRRFLVSASPAIIALLIPLTTFAHATPVSYEPAASSIIQNAPTEIWILFSERIEPSASAITVFDPTGAILPSEKPTVDPANPRALRLGISSSQKGTFAVSWQVVSADDGHFTKGAFSYSVGKESNSVLAASRSFQIIHRTNLIEAFTLWLELVGQAMLVGGLILWMILKNDGRSFTRFFAAGTFLILLGGMLYLAYRTSGPGEGNFLVTVAGRFTLHRMALAILFFVLSAIRKDIRWQKGMLTFLVIVMAVLRARVSHAAASEFLPMMGIGVNAIHLLAKDAWIGLLMAYLFTKHSQSCMVLFTTSRVIAWALGIGAVTGSYIVWLHLKSLDNILNTQWGMTFITLCCFATVLLVLRLSHALAAPKPDTHRFVLWCEMCAGLGVLFASALLIITTPPLPSASHAAQQFTSEGTTISVGPSPSERDQILIDIADPTVQAVTVTLSQEERSIGPIVAKLEQRFAGGYVFPIDSLFPPGTWRIEVTASRPHAYDATGSVELRVPQDLVITSESRHIDGFALLCIVMAVLFALLAVVLERKSISLKRTCPPHVSWTLPTLQEHALLSFVMVLMLVMLSLHANVHGAGAFQRACVRAGGMWHESVPMRDGNVMADRPLLGCMLGSGRGQFHIINQRELAWFVRPTVAFATLETPQSALRAARPMTVQIALHDGSGAPLTGITLEHDRVLHAVLLSKDLTEFAHVHAEELGPITPAMLKNATFPVPVTFPRNGQYLLAVDFTVRAQTFQQLFYLQVGTGTMPQPVTDTANEKTFDSIDVRLDTPRRLVAQSPQTLSYIFTQSGNAVTNLQPYLSAAMHLSVVRTDGRQFVHTHAFVRPAFLDRLLAPRVSATAHNHLPPPDRFGPQLDTVITFPTPGTYALFGETLHQGKILRTRFDVTVE